MRSIIYIITLLLTSSLGNAQSDQQYLSKVGIVDTIFSEILNQNREFYIQLPDSYSPENKRKYPSAYILDGGVFLPIVSQVHAFYSGGFMPEMILVGISNASNRSKDLTPTSVDTLFGRPARNETGGADKFRQFIELELIPFVESKYPTTPYRTLIGHSYAGLFAIHSLLNHSNSFANYLAIDPGLDWDDQELIKVAKTTLAVQEFNGKSLFISLSGQLHKQDPEVTIENVMSDTTDFTLFSRSNITFSNLIREHAPGGLTFDWKFYKDELHGTIPFPSIREGLISLFSWFQMEKTDLFNNPATSKDELYKVIKYREKKLQEHFGYIEPPYSEELINVLGYMSMDVQQTEKAKMFFDFAIQYYPESPNVYDSMADYYEAQNDFENALKNITQAYEVSGSDYYKDRMEKLKAKVND